MATLTEERAPDPTSGRRGPRRWLVWILCLVVVPLLLAAVALLWPRPQLQDDLTARATAALTSAGFGSAEVRFSGRDGTITGVPAGREQEAIAIVEQVAGVRVADVDGTAAAALAPAGAALGSSGSAGAAGGTFGITVQATTVVVSGSVPDESTRTTLLDAARARSGGRPVVDQLTVAAGATLPPGVNVGSVGSAVDVLGATPGDRALSIVGSKVTLSGTVPDDATKVSAEVAMHAALPGAEITNSLTVGVGLSDAGKQQLQAQLSAIVATSPITFQPNTAALTPDGAASVARVLEVLRTVPAADVLVSGHVAALGRGGSAVVAQQLSDARAAAVAQALVAGGITADRVAAQGFGDTQPLATPAASRRVEITVR